MQAQGEIIKESSEELTTWKSAVVSTCRSIPECENYVEKLKEQGRSLPPDKYSFI